MALIDWAATVFFSKKDNIAKAIIHSVAVEAGAVGLATAQIPGDRFVIGGLQIGMVMRLATVYGVRLDRAGAAAIAKAAVAMAVAPEVVNQGVKYLPILGNVVNLGTAAGVTELIGWTAVKMFKDGTWFQKAKA